MNLRISKFVKIVKINKYYYLYNTISHELFILDDKTLLFDLEKLKSNNSKLYNKLLKLNFIILDNNEVIFNKIYSEKNKKKNEFSLLRILMTDLCNLNCKYCKVENNIANKTHAFVSKEDLTETLKLFQKVSPKKRKLVSISGGEPMLFKEKIKEIVMLSKKILDNYWVILFTNATLVTDEIADFLKKEKVFIVISLDGKKDTHDKLRITHDGLGSYDKMMIGYEKFKERGCQIGFSCTVGNHNIDVFVNEMGNIIEKFHPNSIGINPLKYPIYTAVDSTLIPSPKIYANKLFDLYVKSADSKVFIEQLYRKMSPFIEKKFKYYDCGACGKNINLDAKGNIGHCKSFLIMGTLYQKNKDEINFDIFEKLFNRSTLENKKCLSCAALGMCGTGCAYEAFVETGDGNNISPRGCIISLTLLKRVLMFVYIKNNKKIDKGLFADSYYYFSDRDRAETFGTFGTKRGTLAYSVGHLI